MKCVSMVLSVLMCLAASHAVAQSEADQVKTIRDQIQALQDKLKAVEDSQSSSATRQRTTQLGRTRIVEEEPLMVVQIYDLSDLLAMVAPYPGMVRNDLGPFDTPLFPGLPAETGGVSGIGGMGGMGGMGMGGMGMGGMGGGFMNVDARRARPAPSHTPAPNPPPGTTAPPAPVATYTLTATPTKPLPGGLNGVRIDLDAIIHAITSTIEPTTWEDVGGPGSIAPLGNSLIISASARVHEQITTLFDTFRKRWGTLRTVSVQAHWLWLDDTQLASLLAGAAKDADRPAFGLVNDTAWESLLKELRQPGKPADKPQPAGYQAVITCYNGQTVYVVSGSQRRLIAGMIPMPESQVVGYQPQVETLQEGAAMQVTPMVTSNGKLVVLDVHSRVVLVRDKPPAPPADAKPVFAKAGPAADVSAAIDRVQLANQHLETTLRVPVDRRMLVGGMTFEAQPKPGEPALYLFVKPIVQELRDDQKPEDKPVAKKPAK